MLCLGAGLGIGGLDCVESGFFSCRRAQITASNCSATIDLANAVDFSLHAGIFTSRLDIALDASSRIEAGGVMVNDSSDYRFDAMPFGGFKYGSLGREGVRFAYEEMTQAKVVCINRQ